jgi:hypothetical protein
MRKNKYNKKNFFFFSNKRQPDIPSNATLAFRIHLKDSKDLPQLEETSPLERCSLGQNKKLRGNFHFNRKDYHLAIETYKRGLKYFALENLMGTEEDEDLKKFQELRLSMSMNLALSYFKVKTG